MIRMTQLMTTIIIIFFLKFKKKLIRLESQVKFSSRLDRADSLIFHVDLILYRNKACVILLVLDPASKKASKLTSKNAIEQVKMRVESFPRLFDTFL
jgi:hypothetical protein